MNNPNASCAPPSALPLLVLAWIGLFSDAAQSARRALDARLAERRRASDDHDALLAMSDRERRDIGLPPSGRLARDDGWVGGWAR